MLTTQGGWFGDEGDFHNARQLAGIEYLAHSFVLGSHVASDLYFGLGFQVRDLLEFVDQRWYVLDTLVIPVNCLPDRPR